jgi:hypothetical protein
VERCKRAYRKWRMGGQTLVPLGLGYGECDVLPRLTTGVANGSLNRGHYPFSAVLGVWV